MCSRGSTRMWVGARGAMFRNATHRSSSCTLVEVISSRTIRQNRQSSGMGRACVDDPAVRPLADRRVDAEDRDPGNRVVERAPAWLPGRDEDMVLGMADPATVLEARLEQD